MPFCMIRAHVSSTGKVLPQWHDDRGLLHFMFGRRDEIVLDDPDPSGLIAAAAGGRAAKRLRIDWIETLLRAAPGDIFGKIVGYVVSLPDDAVEEE